MRRTTVPALAVCVAALGSGLLIGPDCDASDSLQGVMIIGLPIVAGTAAALAARKVWPVLVVSPAALVVFLAVWIGTCSS
ncbi:MAG TPA: hypothetical protein VK486_15695 [Thermoleophilaceae bacterium]|nr:hypothetical protein [Thermoleophilaceae bacterium]